MQGQVCPEQVYLGQVAAANAFFLSPARSVKNFRARQDLRDVLQAEEDLQHLADSGELAHLSSAALRKYDKVAVRAGGAWRRGMALQDRRGGGGGGSNILAVDTGDVLREVGSEDLRRLPERLHKTPKPLWFKFKLNRVEPTGAGGGWSQEATIMVRRLARAADGAEILSALKGPSGGCFLGDLLIHLPEGDHTSKYLKPYRHFITEDARQVSLTDLLMKAGHAVMTKERTTPAPNPPTGPHQDRKSDKSSEELRTASSGDSSEFHTPRSWANSACSKGTGNHSSRSSKLDEVLSTQEGRSRQLQRLLNGGVIKIGEERDVEARFLPHSTSTPNASPTPSDREDDRQERRDALDVKREAGCLPRKDEMTSPSAISPVVVHQDPSTRRIKLVHNSSEITWCPEIDLLLGQFGLCRASPVQSALWPSVRSRHSVVCVSDRRSGTTMGYLLPILDSLATDEASYPGEPRQSPLAVLVCSSWTRAEALHRQVAHLVRAGCIRFRGKIGPAGDGSGGEEQLKCCLSHRSREAEAAVDVINGCHVLVATLTSFNRMCRDDALDLARCRHLVLEDADDLLERLAEEILELAGVHLKLSPEVQAVLVAERWTEGLEKFMEMYLLPTRFRPTEHRSVSTDTDRLRGGLPGPVLILTSGIQAAVYGRVATTAEYFFDPGDKVTALKKVLGKSAGGGKKVVVSCRDYLCAWEASMELLELGISHYLVHERLSDASKEDEIVAKWRTEVNQNQRSKACAPLILTDLACVAGIVDADLLVNYDIPEASKKMFARRYTHVFGKLRSMYDDEEKPSPESYLFLSKEDAPKLRTIMGFLRASKTVVPVPRKVEELFLERQLEEAAEKKGSKICSSLKLLGRCRRKAFCQGRHFFDQEVDQWSVYLPWDKTIFFHITHIFSPAHFQVVLASSSSSSGLKKDRTRLALLLGLLNDPPSLGRSSTISPGLLCLARDPIASCYKRAEVLAVSSANRDSSGEAQVLFVDDGSVAGVRDPGRELFALPEAASLDKFPRQSLEFVLCGVAPADKDVEWGEAAMDKARLLLKPVIVDYGDSERPRNMVCRAEAQVTQGDVVWSEELSVCYLDGNRARVCNKLRKTLLGSGHAEENPDHLENVAALANKAGFATYLGDDGENGAQKSDGEIEGNKSDPVEKRSDSKSGCSDTGRGSVNRSTERKDPGAEDIPLPSDTSSSDVSSLSYLRRRKNNNFHKATQEGLPEAAAAIAAPQHDARKIRVVDLPEDMPSLSVIKGLLKRALTVHQKLPPVTWRQESEVVSLTVNLSSLPQTSQKAAAYVRISKESLKMQLLAVETVATEDHSCQEEEKYFLADYPILWMRYEVVPGKATLEKTDTSVVIKLPRRKDFNCRGGQQDNQEGANLEHQGDQGENGAPPFVKSLCDNEIARHAWLRADFDLYGGGGDDEDGDDDDLYSEKRRRFFAAKMAATGEGDVPRHPGGRMPWEEGGDDGGAGRTQAPVRPLPEFYYSTTTDTTGSNGNGSSNFPWDGGEADIDDVVDWTRYKK